MAEAKLLKASGVMDEKFESWLTKWFEKNWDQREVVAQVWAEKLIEDYLDHLQDNLPKA
jgi:hypothetical protein